MKFNTLACALFLVGLCFSEANEQHLVGSSVGPDASSKVAGKDVGPTAARKLQVDRQVTFGSTGCVDYQRDGSWTEIPPYKHFDGFTEVNLDFKFDLGEVSYDKIFINDNGHITFDKEYYLKFDPTKMPAAVPMVAPFWADNHLVDGGGIIRYKKFANKIAIMWADVWPYSGGTGVQTMAYNTFSVVISDGKAPEMGNGNNICFCYENMEWTTGADSDGVDGFRGIPGTAGGVTAANGLFYQLGQFDRAGNEYHGSQNTDNQIDALDNVGFCIGNADLGSTYPDIQSLPKSKAPKPSSRGDPHFVTWQDEHFEYHGQCDLVLTSDPGFADGLGLDIHIRTKLVRYWSYIKNAVIRIGDDILEITGGEKASYWLNFEFQGHLSTVGGFQVTMNNEKNIYTIDLNKKYRGLSIQIKAYKEFVGVKFVGASARAFGNTIGMLGDFATGKTLARDGETELNDFLEFGQEWQVRPPEPFLFHETSNPQFPEACILPEDPRGERRRRLDESFIAMEAAEAACASLEDEATRKDCVYDVLATQDLDMVGAF